MGGVVFAGLLYHTYRRYHLMIFVMGCHRSFIPSKNWRLDVGELSLCFPV